MATLKQIKRGLSLRPTYDEVLISYLSGGPDIKKPDRTASFIRESPQYQDLLKTDFLELQKQQNDMLQSEKKHIILKEMASQTNSDVKSVLASESPSESEATQQVQSDFNALSKVWNHTNLSRRRKVHLYISLIESRLLYGLSATVMRKADQHKPDGFQARCLRRALRIPPSWKSRVSNATVLEKAEHVKASVQLRRKQLLYLGKVIRSDTDSPLRAVSFL